MVCNGELGHAWMSVGVQKLFTGDAGRWMKEKRQTNMFTWLISFKFLVDFSRAIFSSKTLSDLQLTLFFIKNKKITFFGFLSIIPSCNIIRNNFDDQIMHRNRLVYTVAYRCTCQFKYV